IHFTSTDPQAVLPVDYTFGGGDNGVHTFTNGVTLKTGGSRSITATDTLNASVNGTQAGITVNPGAPTALGVSGIASPRPSGQASDVTVTATDSFGNTATNYTGTV